jgi:hypothetical protein
MDERVDLPNGSGIVGASRASHGRGGMRLACLVAVAAALVLAALLPQVASAQVEISTTPSTTKPYTPCPPGAMLVQCNLIVDPPAVHTSSGYAMPSGGPLLGGGGVGGGLDPADLRSAYHLPLDTYRGTGQTVAVIESHAYGTAESDLGVYREKYGLEPCTTSNGCFKKVNQLGEEGNYPTEGSTGWAEETALDMDMVSAACSKCQILVVEAKSEEPVNMAASVQEAAKLGATVISNSYGYAEKEAACGTKGCSQFLEAYDQEAKGIPVTASSGDYGYEGRGKLGPEWPATSPNVIAVGGTSLEKAIGGRGWTEKVWGLSGSGCSQYEAKPTWQTDTGCANRTDNDVAAVGAEGTPVSIYVTPAGGWNNVAGTSVSAPLIAGIDAMSGQSTESLGGDAFYLAAREHRLFDITEGFDGTCSPTYLCTAEVGYDGPTGNGAPVGPVLPDEWRLAGVAWPEAIATTWKSGSKVKVTDPKFEATVECEDTGTGADGPAYAGEITQWTATKCVYVKEGLCKGTPTVEAMHLPWHTELIKIAGTVRETSVNVGEGAPGFKLGCTALGIKGAMECVGPMIANTTNTTSGVTAAFESTGLSCEGLLGKDTGGKFEGSQKLEARDGLLSAASNAETVKLREGEWRRSGASLTEPVATSWKGTLRFTESVLETTVECEDAGSGSVGPGLAGEVTHWTATKCVYVKEGKCKGAVTAEGWHLSWHSELADLGGAMHDVMLSDGSGLPGFRMWCTMLGSKGATECTGAVSAATSNTSSGVTATFSESEKLGCENGVLGGKGTGAVGGSQKIETTGGGKLEAVS